MADAILVVDRLEKRFGGNRAVDGASFEVARGSITGLIGPNGAGKTTCFNCIAGAIRPDGGRVTLNGQDVTGWPPHRVYAQGLSRTFQIPQELSGMTVLENVMLTARDHPGENLWEPILRPWRVASREAEVREHAMAMLRQVNLEPLAHERAGTLSGGQRKLLELARALMADPELVLLDEPSAGVNPTLASRLVEDIRTINRERGVTFLVIGHDMDVVARLCDRLVVMTSGRVMVEGTPDEVLNNAEVQEAYLGSQYR
ncbi:MAG: ABC transporter ATP-binding protein [Dehalococcoidia bacterium]|nr:ABC transporter ATP-binding protein [Dehalococcoidia bacterium]